MVGYCETVDDLVVQDRVPPRDGIDEWRIENLHVFWKMKVQHDLVEMKHGDHVPMVGMLHVRCRRKDLPPVESPDDWVPLTDGNHVLRKDIDWIKDLSPLSGSDGEYEQVKSYAGRLRSHRNVGAAQCRRKDHPDYQAKPVEPQTFRVGDTVCIRGTREVTFVNYVAKDGLVRLESRLNPAYWFNPAVLDLVARAEQSFPMLPADRKAIVTEPVRKEVEGLESARKHLDSLPEWQREALFKGYGLR